MPPIWKRLFLDAADSPRAAEIVVKEIPPPEEYRINLATERAGNAYHPDYTKVEAPALAFYAISERHAAITPQTDEETRRKMNDWWKAVSLPYQRRSIEQFRKEMRRGQVVEMKDATHYVFMGKTADEVVRRTREFLLKRG